MNKEAIIIKDIKVDEPIKEELPVIEYKLILQTDPVVDNSVVIAYIPELKKDDVGNEKVLYVKKERLYTEIVAEKQDKLAEITKIQNEIVELDKQIALK